jgi:hypothetical protein
MKPWRKDTTLSILVNQISNYVLSLLPNYLKWHLLYDDAINAATLHLWLSKGEGFKVEFLDCPGQTLLVKWKDLQDATSPSLFQASVMALTMKTKPSTRQKNSMMGYFPALLLLLFTMGLFEYNGTTTLLP